MLISKTITNNITYVTNLITSSASLVVLVSFSFISFHHFFFASAPPSLPKPYPLILTMYGGECSLASAQQSMIYPFSVQNIPQHHIHTCYNTFTHIQCSSTNLHSHSLCDRICAGASAQGPDSDLWTPWLNEPDTHRRTD
jgi:hypothetical protein